MPDSTIPITEYYIEARYPIGISTLFSRAGLESDLQTARFLAAMIQEKVGP